jgi:hypothetical protein
MLELTDEQMQKLPKTEGMKIDGNRVSLDPETIVTGAKTDVGAVPMSQLATPAEALTLPEPSMVDVDTSSVSGAQQQATSLLEQENQRAQQEQAQAETKLSESERAIRASAGLLSEEMGDRAQMEEDIGVVRAREASLKAAQGISRAIQNLQQFDLDFTNQLEQTRVDMAKRDLTQRTFSAHSAEANLQKSIQRAGMVASINAQQAGLEVLQGNIQQAVDSIDRAMTAKYEPIRRDLEMEKFFYERNAGSFDSAQQRAANVRMAEIEKEKRQIENAQERVNQAVESGYATPDDMAAMARIEDPAEQQAFANRLVARGAAIERMQEQQRGEMSLLTQRLQAQRLQKEIALMGEPTQEEIKAIEEQMKTAKASIEAANDKLQTIDILKDHKGLNSRVGTTVITRGLISIDPFTGAGQDFAGGIHKLVAGLSLDSLIEAKARGATFGALSNEELRMLSSAASTIADWENKKDGVGTGYWNIDEASFKRELDTIAKLSRKAIERSAGSFVTPEEDALLDEVMQEVNTSLQPGINYYN